MGRMRRSRRMRTRIGMMRRGRVRRMADWLAGCGWIWTEIGWRGWLAGWLAGWRLAGWLAGLARTQKGSTWDQAGSEQKVMDL